MRSISKRCGRPRPHPTVMALLENIQKQWVRCVLLALIGIAVRAPALQGQLIWDDGFLADGNPMIKSPILILETFRHHLMLDSFSAHYRPVQTISYMFDYFFWNTNPYGFHLSNIFWHVGSGLLLYLLLRELINSLVTGSAEPDGSASPGNRCASAGNVAFVVALLWTVHPVHSAAVDYISGRADSLAFFFSCGAWLLYLRARRISHPARRGAGYAAAGAVACLALCARESALMWMGIFLLYLFAFDKKPPLRAKFFVLAACVCVVAAYAGLRSLPPDHLPPATAGGSPLPLRATLMLRALGDYSRLMVFPWNLHMERTVEDARAGISNEGWRSSVASEYLSILGLAVAALLLIGASRRGAAQPLRVAGATWFIVSYLPISNLIELNATVAEHWLYLPSVGFLLFLGGCCLELPTRGRNFAAAVAGVAVLALSARSFVRSSDWVNPETFYRRTLVAGGSSVRVALNLGQIYASQKQYAKAEILFRKVLQLTPNYPVAQTNLGDVLLKQGKAEEAQRVFAAAHRASEKARVDFSRTWLAALSLAHLRIDAQDFAGAAAILEKARQDYPGTWPLVSLNAEVLRQLQQTDAAIAIVEEFARDHWWHAGAAVALGRLYAEKNDAVRATDVLRQASWLDVHDAESLDLIAQMQMRSGKLEDACRTARRAVSRQPDQPRQYLLLADILQKMGHSAEAHETLETLSRLEALAHSPVAAN